jgi:hypothetical protein
MDYLGTHGLARRCAARLGRPWDGVKVDGLVVGKIGLSGIELVERCAEGAGSEPPERKDFLTPRSSQVNTHA